MVFGPIIICLKHSQKWMPIDWLIDYKWKQILEREQIVTLDFVTASSIKKMLMVCRKYAFISFINIS